jgi:ABC-2 type transport system ATP-binding protein
MVVTTQVVSEAIYCDFVAVMRKGRILAVDTPTGLRKMALGGEIIDVTLASPDDLRRAIESLKRWNGVVKDARRSPASESDLHVVVDDAREWLPEVLNRLENQRPRIVVTSAAPIEVSYDEIFIKIMQMDEQKQAAHA